MGTKLDLVGYEDHPIDEYLEELIKENENVINFLRISSKTGENIKMAFEILIANISGWN